MNFLRQGNLAKKKAGGKQQMECDDEAIIINGPWRKEELSKGH